MSNTVFHPVQNERDIHNLPEAVVLRAYEVYCHLYGQHPAMVNITTGCRDGFSVGEIIAFLYARSFPKEQWRDLVDAAFERLKMSVGGSTP